MEELAPYIGPIVTGLIAAIGVYAGMTKKLAIIETKMDMLSEHVQSHNSLAERTIKLEMRMDALEGKQG